MATGTRPEVDALPNAVREAALAEAMAFYRNQHPGRWTEEELAEMAEADVSFQMSGGVNTKLIIDRQAPAERKAA